MLDVLGGPTGLIVLLLAVAAGGFVNGLTGFGTALTSMPVLLIMFDPVFSAQIAAMIGVAGQVSALNEIADRSLWRRMIPMLMGGLIGIPVGTLLVPHVPTEAFKLAIGVLLVVYTVSMLGAWQACLACCPRFRRRLRFGRKTSAELSFECSISRS
jgi:uncharacterized protein